MTAADCWVLAIAVLVGVACSLPGVFIVLRRMSMLGDAISHSVLFGIAAGFLLFSSRSVIIMLASAAAVGLLTAYLSSVLHRHGRLQEDASIGVVFTWLFALGVILISAFAGRVDLDLDCVLYGEIAFAPFDELELFGTALGPRAFWVLLLVTLCNAIFVVGASRTLKIVAFDETLAKSLGISVSLWHYLLMTVVSITTVASFEAVGAILVVAMLVVPANAAYLLVHSVRGMLILAALFSVAAALGGYQLAALADASISAAMAVAAGGILLAVLVITRVQVFVSRRFMANTDSN